jgi:hypothetical protein
MIGAIVWCHILIGWAEPVMMKGRVVANDVKVCYSDTCYDAYVIEFKNGDLNVRPKDECFNKKREIK